MTRAGQIMLARQLLQGTQEIKFIQVFNPLSSSGATTRRWTVADAIDLDVPAPVITMALMMRFVSRDDQKFAAKVLAAMRKGFGGHAVKTVA